MAQDILNSVLTEEQRAGGLRIEFDKPHYPTKINILYKGSLIDDIPFDSKIIHIQEKLANVW